ncbi:hypothetical protein QR680_018859 [Steinernema hermaphroditum]|uniref:Uncharacterized protein n=1 Tax=Steinernema hermaphroditum TaxID=289476 RepID=A0AA39HLJ4_9BILA|nr:hypothetical protein QR680_018859 [Steinernema hermaphroditum]
MEDPELDAIRTRRMNQLQRPGGVGNKQNDAQARQADQQEEMDTSILSQENNYPFLVDRPEVVSDKEFWERMMARMENLGIPVTERKKKAKTTWMPRKRPADGPSKDRSRRRVTFDLDDD